MIYQGVLIVQGMIVVGTYFYAIMISRERLNNVSKMTFLITFLCLIENVSYFMEMKAQTMEAAMTANRIKYVGAAYIVTFFLIFVGKFCQRRIPYAIQALLCVWNSFVMILVWKSDEYPLYYKSVKFVETGVMPHLEKEHGIIYNMNSALVLIQLGTCLVLVILSWIQADEVKRKNGYRSLLLCMLVPALALPLERMEAFQGVQMARSFFTIGILSFFVTIMFQDMFDMADVAHDNIISNMKEPVIIVDNDYGFVEANPTARELYPSLSTCKAGEVLPEPELLGYIRSGMMDRLFLKNYVYEVHVDRIYDDAAPIGYSVLLMDITQSQMQLKKIRTLMTEAKDANEAKTEFLANMSHELRTPINSILGMDEMILRESEKPEIKKYAGDVKNAATMLLSLVNDILDSSKIASGKLNIIPVQYNLGDVISDLYNMLANRAKQKNLDFVFEIDENLPSTYMGDDIRIRQILINLLTNAIKYTEKGSVTLKVTGDCDAEEAVLHFSIIDTGYGIRKEHIDQMFSRFDRVDEKRNRHIEGTGLGLNVTARLLELMDSAIQIESEVDKGSRFYFDLEQPILDETPMGPFDQRAAVTDLAEEYDVSFRAPKAHVLVVDDNEMNLNVFSSLLKETEIQITQADGGMKCIELIQENPYDIIFLDHMMPDMDGIETLKYMQKLKDHPCKNTPVIMLTANVIAGAKEKYIAEGFTDFLSKPIFADQLESLVKKYLPKELVETTGAIKLDTPNAQKKSRIPEMEEIDYDYAIGLWKDDELLYSSMQDFYAAIPKNKEKLEMYVEGIEQEETMEAYRIVLHTLKGTSAMVGALLLSKLCRLMEVAAKEEQVERVRLLHPILIEELDKHRKRMEIIAPKKSKGSDGDILGIMQMLEDALNRQDFTTADFMVKQLEMLEIDESKEEIMDGLFDAILMLDQEKSLVYVKKMIEELTSD